MSVQLFTIEETQKIGNTLARDPRVQEFVETTIEFKNYKAGSFGSVTAESFISRAVWYGYVANVTAYNLQYQENEQIDFETESDEDFDFMTEAIYQLGSLNYNCYTNDGNCFLQDKWMNVLLGIYGAFKSELVEPEMESYHY